MGKKKSKGVHFSTHERRVFGLPFEGEIKGADALALRKVLDAFPWISLPAECQFDRGVTNAVVVSEAVKITAEERVDKALKEYQEKK